MLSPLTSYQSNGPAFFIVMTKGFLPSVDLVRNKVLEERGLLGREAMITLGGDILTNMQKKGAYNLELTATRSQNPPSAKPQVSPQVNNE